MQRALPRTEAIIGGMLVVDEAFFRSRLGDLFAYSILPYMEGTGTLRIAGNSYECEWALNVSPQGQPLLTLTTGEYARTLFADSGQPFPQTILEGLTSDGDWRLAASNLRTSRSTLDSDLRFFYVCRPRDVMLSSISADGAQPDRIRALLTNFKFDGLEVSKYENRWALDRFTIPIAGNVAEFRPLNRQDELLELIGNGRLDRAILSTLSLSTAHAGLASAEALVSTLCSMATFACFSMVNDPVTEYYAGETLTRIVVRDLISSRYNPAVVIDNFYVDKGLRIYLEECLAKFSELDATMDLRRLIRGCIGMTEGAFTENKVAGLIMSLEYLVTKQLKELQARFSEDDSIESKIGNLDKYVRFIPKDCRGGDLRRLARNPLFHTGEALITDSLDFYRLYSKYTDLLIRLVLRALGYKGKFISRLTWEPVDV